MSYTLQAIILEKPEDQILEGLGLHAVKIASSLFLIPLTYEYVERNGIPFLPLTDEGLTDIDGRLLEICLNVSLSGKAAYVEAEFFGSAGTQACGLYEKGNVIEAAQENSSAINHALRWLGVQSNGAQDEFAVVGLGMQRNTEDWLNA